MRGGLKHVDWEQGSIDEESGAGNQSVYWARISYAVALEVDLFEIQRIVIKRR